MAVYFGMDADMFSLSSTAGYAIQALTCLADERCDHGSIQTIAECSGVPRPYLAKVLKRLNEAGIVASKRGYTGGVWLAKPPKEVSLLDIARAIDGDEYFSNCLLGSEFCSDGRACPTHRFWKSTRAAIQEELGRTSLADVVAFHKRRASARRRRAG